MAAISSVADLELIDIEKIVAESSTYIEDYKNKLEKGDMIKMVRTQESAIKAKMRLLIKSNTEKVQSIKELEKEYKVPFAELDVMWLQVKSKMGIVNKHASKKNIAEEEVKEVIEEIALDKADKDKIEENKTIIAKDIEDSKTKSKIEYKGNGEIKFTVENKPKLKILEQTIKVQGEYGIYEKSLEGVKTENKIFKDIVELESGKKIIESNYNAQKGKIETEIKELTKELDDLAKDRQEELGKYTEIEEVFNM